MDYPRDPNERLTQLVHGPDCRWPREPFPDLYGPPNYLGGMSQADTYFLAAIERGDSEVVERIVREGRTDLNRYSPRGLLPLVSAVRSTHCDVDIVRLLVQHGADVNGTELKGCTPLTTAICRGNSAKFHYLLQCDVDVDLVDNRGYSPLAMAALNYSIGPEATRLLVKAGADVNLNNPEAMESPLVCACFWGSHYDSLKILLEAGANVRATNKRGATPVEWTLINGTPDKLRLLLSYGAIIGNALHSAVSHNRSDIVQMLAENGGVPSALNFKSCTKHFLACGIEAMIHVVPLQGDDDKVSPFTLALCCGHMDMAKYFFSAWFLHTSDILTGPKLAVFRERLIKEGESEGVKYLDEISSSPWSLTCLSFIAVSTAVGFQEDRAARVDKLGLPRVMKQRLTYFDQDILRNCISCFGKGLECKRKSR